jgi:hypothetical protein
MDTGADQARFGLLLSASYALPAILALVLGRHHIVTPRAETADEQSDIRQVS